MTDQFTREDRYIVIKRKDMNALPEGLRAKFDDLLDVVNQHLPKRECLVIESDWPEYEPTWNAIQNRMIGENQMTNDLNTMTQAELINYVERLEVTVKGLVTERLSQLATIAMKLAKGVLERSHSEPGTKEWECEKEALQALEEALAQIGGE